MLTLIVSTVFLSITWMLPHLVFEVQSDEERSSRWSVWLCALTCGLALWLVAAEHESADTIFLVAVIAVLTVAANWLSPIRKTLGVINPEPEAPHEHPLMISISYYLATFFMPLLAYMAVNIDSLNDLLLAQTSTATAVCQLLISTSIFMLAGLAMRLGDPRVQAAVAARGIAADSFVSTIWLRVVLASIWNVSLVVFTVVGLLGAATDSAASSDRAVASTLLVPLLAGVVAFFYLYLFRSLLPRTRRRAVSRSRPERISELGARDLVMVVLGGLAIGTISWMSVREYDIADVGARNWTGAVFLAMVVSYAIWTNMRLKMQDIEMSDLGRISRTVLILQVPGTLVLVLMAFFPLLTSDVTLLTPARVGDAVIAFAALTCFNSLVGTTIYFGINGPSFLDVHRSLDDWIQQGTNLLMHLGNAVVVLLIVYLAGGRNPDGSNISQDAVGASVFYILAIGVVYIYGGYINGPLRIRFLDIDGLKNRIAPRLDGSLPFDFSDSALHIAIRVRHGWKEMSGVLNYLAALYFSTAVLVGFLLA